jgi:DNA polymerase-3 subunit alpha/error-prone DNA polymerase
LEDEGASVDRTTATHDEPLEQKLTGKLQARSLIDSGALDSLDSAASRPALRWQLAQWQRARRRRKGPADLFAPHCGAVASPPLPPEPPRIRLRREFAALGFLCSTHPMTLFREAVRRRTRVKVIDLPRFIGRRVRLAAWLITGKVVHTKKGDPMEFLTFEDETGIVETTWFPAAYQKFCHMVDRGRPYLLSGRVEQDWGALTLTVDGAATLSSAEASTEAPEKPNSLTMAPL